MCISPFRIRYSVKRYSGEISRLGKRIARYKSFGENRLADPFKSGPSAPAPEWQPWQARLAKSLLPRFGSPIDQSTLARVCSHLEAFTRPEPVASAAWFGCAAANQSKSGCQAASSSSGLVLFSVGMASGWPDHLAKRLTICLRVIALPPGPHSRRSFRISLAKSFGWLLGDNCLKAVREVAVSYTHLTLPTNREV